VNWAGWTITAYACGFVVMLPISGKLAMRYGNRKVFLGSVVAFTFASLLCGLATNIYMLIALRALQAAGGAGFTPSATGIIVQHFGDARDRAVGLFGSIFPLGAMIGPVFGGLIVSTLGWRYIFLVNVPIGFVVSLLALRHIPLDRGRESRADTHIDLFALALLGIGLLSLMLAAAAMGDAQTHFWSPSFVLPLVVAIVSLWRFVHRIHRSASPVIMPRLIHGSDFGIVNLVNIIYGGAAIGLLVLVPLYATNRYGMNALDAGTLLLAQGISAIIFSTVAAFILRHTGYRLPLYVGSLISTSGLLLLALTPLAGLPPFVWLASSTFLVGTGGGIINPSSRNAGLQLAPEQAPSIAAVRSMCMQIGRILSVSIVTAVLANSGDPGHAQAWTYAAMALVMILALPLIARMPEHHGSW